MEATNTTKQYLKNYDGGILLPFTTLDCILSDEESDITGAEAIISSILSKDDLLIYEKNAEHNGDQYIHQSNLSGDNLHMLGIYHDGEHNNFIKMHAISDDESSSNQYLGADGAVHTIGNGNGDDIDIDQSSLSGLLSTTTNPTWFEGKVMFDSSSCSISLTPRLNQDDFYVEQGALRVRTADHVRQAQILVDGNTNNPINIGQDNKANLIKFVNGIPTESNATIGDNQTILRLNKGIFEKSTANVGGIVKNGDVITGIKPIYLESGVINDFGNNSAFGPDSPNENKPSYVLCLSQGVITKNVNSSIGADDTLIYIDSGEFKTSEKTIGDNNTPLRLAKGKLLSCVGCGTSAQPIYLDSSTNSFSLVTSMDVGYFAKPTFSEGHPLRTCALLSIADTTNNTITNEWTTLDDLMNNHISDVEISADPNNSSFAKTLIARPTGPSTGKLKLGWEELPHSVKIEANTDGDKAFYLTGVYSGTPVTSSDETAIISDWEEYHDIKNKLATKLEVAISGIYNVPDDANNGRTATGIYFKNCKLYQTSDERLKTFVSEFKDDTDLLEHISTIKKGNFYWTSDKKQKLDIGVTAQTVEKYFPELVDEDKGVKTVSYSKLSVVALAAIDKLNEKVKELEKEIEDLKNKK